MAGMYWYVSKQKIDALYESYGPQGGWLRDASLKAKLLIFEAQVGIKPDASLYRKVEQIEAAICQSAESFSFDDQSIPDGRLFVIFNGRGHRTVEGREFWVALHSGQRALLLCGSASNAIGAAVKESDSISPSADPFQAVVKAFTADLRNKEEADITRQCSYAWCSIAKPWLAYWDRLPTVYGIALCAGIFPAKKSEFAIAGLPQITEIVIGSPIFVKQI